ARTPRDSDCRSGAAMPSGTPVAPSPRPKTPSPGPTPKVQGPRPKAAQGPRSKAQLQPAAEKDPIVIAITDRPRDRAHLEPGLAQHAAPCRLREEPLGVRVEAGRDRRAVAEQERVVHQAGRVGWIRVPGPF